MLNIVGKLLKTIHKKEECIVKNEVTHAAKCVRCVRARRYGPRFGDISGDGRQLRLAPALLPSLA